MCLSSSQLTNSCLCGVQVEFSSLDFLLHTKALLSTISYLKSCMPPELATTRNPDSRKEVEKTRQGHTGECKLSTGVTVFCVWSLFDLCFSSVQCLKESNMVAYSASSFLLCWVLSMLRCVMITLASLTLESKVRHIVQHTQEELTEMLTWILMSSHGSCYPAGIDASVLVQAKETEVSARLRNIMVTDVSPSTIHKKVGPTKPLIVTDVQRLITVF